MKLGHSLRDRPIHRARWRALTLVTGLLVFVAAGEWAGAERTTIGTATGVPLGRLTPGVRRSDLNVLVITLDTTRADRLAAYGFTGVKTPNLDRLAREGVRFDQTAAAAPLTSQPTAACSQVACRRSTAPATTASYSALVRRRWLRC